jgi:hypothetical protein
VTAHPDSRILARQDAAKQIGLFRAGRLVEVLAAVPVRLGDDEEVLTICPRHPDVAVIDCIACDTDGGVSS